MVERNHESPLIFFHGLLGIAEESNLKNIQNIFKYKDKRTRKEKTNAVGTKNEE